MSHNRLEPIVELPEATAEATTLQDLLDIAREKLGETAVLEFDGELVVDFTCPECDNHEYVFQRMARLYDAAAACPNCGTKRDMHLTHRISGDEAYLDRTLAEVDVPPLAIVRARSDSQRLYLELTGDKETFLRFS